MNIDNRLDKLTKTWNEDSIREAVDEYLIGKSSLDSACIFHLDGWDVFREFGGAVADTVLRDFSAVLMSCMRGVDIVSRIGASTFFVFAPGCGKEAMQENIKAVSAAVDEKGILKNKNIVLKSGAALSCGGIKEYSELYKMAAAALALFKGEPRFIAEGEEYSLEDSLNILEIPTYKKDSGNVDADHVVDIVNSIYSGENLIMGINIALYKMCKYFNAEQIFIAERSLEEKKFEITYEWRTKERRIVNKNLDTMPLYVGMEVMRLFDRDYMFVCNSMDELSAKNSFLSERHKIRGTKSMMEHIVLESGTYIGYMCLCDQKSERVWTQREIQTFAAEAKIISSSVIQQRTMRYSRMVTDRDLLTNCWTLNKFCDEGEKRLRSDRESVAIVTVDIKNFKYINKHCGYEEGSRILVDISKSLKRMLSPKEALARIDADVFVMLLQYDGKENMMRRVEQMLQKLERVGASHDLGMPVTYMIGICRAEKYPDEDIDVLIDHSTIARKTIKSYHKSSYTFYNSYLDKKSKIENDVTNNMKQALQDEEFVVYYQPKIYLPLKKYVGFEALVRWIKPDGTMMTPDKFIPLFEENGFITEVDFYVIKKTCALIKNWIDNGYEIPRVSVNISRIHIKDPDFLDTLIKICDEYEVPHKYLELELTESAFLDDYDGILRVAEEAKRQGFYISMDDFGTGYSSLSMIKDLPLDIIKLDKGFFKNDMSSKEKVVIANIIRLAKDLGMEVISEGIETPEQAAFLSEVGCDYVQGYLFGKPAPVEEIGSYLYKKEG